jgi:hypothetical protein
MHLKMYQGDFGLKSKTQVGREILLHPGLSIVGMPPLALDQLRTRLIVLMSQFAIRHKTS